MLSHTRTLRALIESSLASFEVSSFFLMEKVLRGSTKRKEDYVRCTQCGGDYLAKMVIVQETRRVCVRCRLLNLVEHIPTEAIMKGFTLTELLIVIAIVATLATIIISSIGARNKTLPMKALPAVASQKPC